MKVKILFKDHSVKQFECCWLSNSSTSINNDVLIYVPKSLSPNYIPNRIVACKLSEVLCVEVSV